MTDHGAVRPPLGTVSIVDGVRAKSGRMGWRTSRYSVAGVGAACVQVIRSTLWPDGMITLGTQPRRAAGAAGGPVILRPAAGPRPPMTAAGADHAAPEVKMSRPGQETQAFLDEPWPAPADPAIQPAPSPQERIDTDDPVTDASVGTTEPQGTASLSPSLIAEIGFEFEVPGATVPFRSRGEVLIQGVGWRLETDRVPNTDHSDLEFVLQPMSSMRDIVNAMQDINGIVAKMRDGALSNPARTVTLSEAIKGAVREVSLKKDTTVLVQDVRFRTVMQATYGIGLADIAGVVDELFDAKQAAAIHRGVDAVRQFYAQEYSTSLSDNVGGLVELIVMYLERARSRTGLGNTAHAIFRMMSRSDFVSIFEKLLTEAERQEVRQLLLARPGRDVPDLMEVLGYRASDLVFKYPYVINTKAKTKADGPRVIDWLHSIVHGRNEGPLKKDLLSPPPGYPLHSGNLDADYGMGAMGVDEVNKRVLFEIRGAPYRPSDLPLNGRVLLAVAREYVNAMRHNASLKLDPYIPTRVPEIGIVDELGQVWTNLSGLQGAIARSGQWFAGRKWQTISSVTITPALKRIQKIKDGASLHTLERVLRALDDVEEILQKLHNIPAPLAGAHQILPLIPIFEDSTKAFERALWDAENRLGSHLNAADTILPETQPGDPPARPQGKAGAAARSRLPAPRRPHIDIAPDGTAWASSTTSATYPDGSPVPKNKRSCVEVTLTTLT